ncbi:hypothetical protein JL720_17297 [Aureococcus anophagefferens]|nr:hypothetical protein JL720_17297 [Aureococcus anophagefferens]
MTMGHGLLPSCLVVALLRACATSSEEALRARLQAAASSRSTWSPTAPPRDGAAPPLNLTASLRRRGAHAGAGAPRDADVLVAVLLSGDVSEFAQAPRPSAWPRRVEAAPTSSWRWNRRSAPRPARFDVAALVFEDAPDAPGLDFGERYHHCDAYRSFAAKDKFADLRCDVHQLLARSFLPLRTVDAGPGAGKRAAELLRGLAAPYGVVVLVSGRRFAAAAAYQSRPPRASGAARRPQARRAPSCPGPRSVRGAPAQPGASA